jgi:hypothetical protein
MQRRQLPALKRLVETAGRRAAATGALVGTDRLVLERLTPLDVSNLRIEKHGLPMNVAALAILEGRVLLGRPSRITVLDPLCPASRRHLPPSVTVGARH